MYRKWDSPYKERKKISTEMNLNLPWLIFNILGFSISYGLFLILSSLGIGLVNFFVVNIIDIFILIINIFIGTYLFMRFYEKEIKDSLMTIMFIQAILLSTKILLNLIFIAIQDVMSLSDETSSLNFLNYFIVNMIIIGATSFFVNKGSKIQLIQWKNLIIPLAAIPGLILVSVRFVENPSSFTNDIVILMILVVIFSSISIITAIIGKQISFRTIPYKDLEEMEPLEKDTILLEVKDLKVYYPLYKGTLKRQVGEVKAVDGVSFIIKTGETVGLVGESGCGKTTIAMAILGLIEKTEGEILLKNEPLPSNYSHKIRKRIQMVFQDPDASLNPKKKVWTIIADPLRNILGITDKDVLRKRVLTLLDQVSLKREHMDRYPHEFSGGQKQRIIIARALACNPELIILDEPTSALDVSVQAQILNLLRDLQKRYNFGFLFITHNLSVVNNIANRVNVMYLGKFVEVGSTKQIFSNTTHPYSKALLASRSEVSVEEPKKIFVLKGEIPNPIFPPSGCSFNPRCYAKSLDNSCRKEKPHKIKVEDGHFIWCVNEEVLEEESEFL
jgi:oligopeptide/dipeptide ABC transporter ATP-binding protein